MKTRATRSGIILALVPVFCTFGCGRVSIPPEPLPNMAAVGELRATLEARSSGSGDSADAASEIEPTGWVTLRGSFKVRGSAPAAGPLNVTKDTEVCAPGGRAVYSQSVEVDPSTKGIANVVLYVERIPDSWVHESARGATDEVVFDQKECIFLTHVAKMQTSQSLKVLNSDPVGHNTKIDKTPFNVSVGSGENASFQPAEATREPINISCSVHPWMEAWLLVRDNAYMAVTNPDGTFEIPMLPAGVELDFRVWQEKTKYVQNVTLNGSAVTWKKGKMKITLDSENEANNQMDVEVDASVFN